MKYLFAFVLILSITCSIEAQKIALKSGSLDFLKDQKFLMVQYDYSEMAVGKFDMEADYISKKVAEYNEDEPGRGDEWKEKWIGDRKENFQPKFEELMNKYLDEEGIYLGEENEDAKYTLILKTTFTEPGYNVYVSKKYASINVEAIFVETANPDNVIALIISKNNPGRTYGGGDFDTGIRIGEAYAKCGKELGQYLIKEVF